MKKILLLFILSIYSFFEAQTITFTEAGGWLETAFAKWNPIHNAKSFNVYYSGNGILNQKIDNYLIRNYGTYYRADIPGLAPGSYQITVKPIINGVETEGNTTQNISVKSHDRNGFAFANGRIPGAYKMDGTLKENAIILYITENSKNSIQHDVITSNKNATTKLIGLQEILNGIKKGYDNRPYVFRFIGNITDLAVMEGGDIVIDNKNNINSHITFEGIGNDAVANGWGIRVKNATNIQIMNLGFMNCDSSEGDNIGMQQNNSYIWVHNNDLFYGHAGSDSDQEKGDGTLDSKGTSYATYSYNHFWDSGKSNLLGLSENTTVDLYVTYHHNWYDHSDSRHPRVRYYSTHVYNNYYDGVSKYGIGSAEGSSIFVEGNYFRNTKNPMMISLQGTDVWNTSKQEVDTKIGTFSGEAGGLIKAFNNILDKDIATNSMRFVAYGDSDPLYNITGKISSTDHFDAYVVQSRNEQIPPSVKSLSGNNTYNNFDTDISLYIKDLTIDEPLIARDNTIQYSGRTEGGDFKWTFNNQVDDRSYNVNQPLKDALIKYTSKLVSIQGEGVQTLVNTSSNKDQIVQKENSITPIIFVWGGDTEDVIVSGLPANGLEYSKNSETKTITITGTPTITTEYNIESIGEVGTAIKIEGKITISETAPPTSSTDMIHNFTTANPPKESTFYTIVGNMNSKDGSVEYDGLTLTKNLKIESATSIKFTTTDSSTLTMVFETAFSGKVKVNGKDYTATNGIVNVELEAGNHEITKNNTTNLFYLKTVYKNLSVIDSDKNKGRITIYPNPVFDHLFIKSDESIKAIKIYNFLGQAVKEINNLNTNNIDLRNLATGNYLLIITTNKGSYTKKIMKK